MTAALADVLGNIARGLLAFGDGRGPILHRGTRIVAGPFMAASVWLNGRLP